MIEDIKKFHSEFLSNQGLEFISCVKKMDPELEAEDAEILKEKVYNYHCMFKIGERIIPISFINNCDIRKTFEEAFVLHGLNFNL